MTATEVIPHSLLTDFDIHLFAAGSHYKLYEKLGSTPMALDGVEGAYFAVWAPNAESISVIGNFNKWKNNAHVLHSRWDSSGIWEGFIPGVVEGDTYKYRIKLRGIAAFTEKSDPFAEMCEIPPNTASKVRRFQYKWKDAAWMKNRHKHNTLESPISVYEVHLGSWKRKKDEQNRSLTYRELAAELVPYIKDLGFTHVEFMPVMEHPFFGSWGYQITGYFAPTSRYGSPEDFAYLVDEFHRAGIGVFMDWVPSHFPNDGHGLHKFDGTSLFEHEDLRLGYHPDWSSYIFNYGRNEVRSFLISNAIYWLDRFHVDGIRVDAVASMLYRDYSRKEGQWIPNKYGGRENFEAIAFLREMNEAIYKEFPDVQSIAEESTSWPMVSRPVSAGGLGFGMKWMMGWMNDILKYMKEKHIYRRFHHNSLTFSMMYAFSENFMLPFSHDEVVHGKGSLLGRMPGDEWQRFANIRTLYAWMFTHPGAKLLFMGNEFAQYSEWNHDDSLLWGLYKFDYHSGVAEMIKDLNEIYRNNKAMHELQFQQEGFEWIAFDDTKNSIISFYRSSKEKKNRVLVIGNFTPNSHETYRIGVDETDQFVEIFNSDSLRYGGSGFTNPNAIKIIREPNHSRKNCIELRVPPLGFVILEPKKSPKRKTKKSEKTA